MYKTAISLLFSLLFVFSCDKKPNSIKSVLIPIPNKIVGADLSYVNEIEDCNAVFFANNIQIEPYNFFKTKGCNLVRLRLWNNPTASPYANFEDVVRSIKRAKKEKMAVLLDFHYSDTWADPSRQEIPKAWASIEDTKILGDSLFQFTYKTLEKLARLKLTPEMVQVGNEINSEIMQPIGTHSDSINWKRNTYLIQKGIAAVRAFSEKNEILIEIMLHIAQPENALKWFAIAQEKGIQDYDWIGISYYPLWSKIKFDALPKAIDSLVKTYQKKFLIVETSYPHTLQNIDKANNILTEKSLLKNYPATPQGQKKYLIDLAKITLNSGGNGVVYWEPAWVTSECRTLWGVGSHWDNATLFDAFNNNEALQGFDFYDLKNYD
jgi:arabinogalactan endo-1,4-beta-galactosidase